MWEIVNIKILTPNAHIAELGTSGNIACNRNEDVDFCVRRPLADVVTNSHKDGKTTILT